MPRQSRKAEGALDYTDVSKQWIYCKWSPASTVLNVIIESKTFELSTLMHHHPSPKQWVMPRGSEYSDYSYSENEADALIPECWPSIPVACQRDKLRRERSVTSEDPWLAAWKSFQIIIPDDYLPNTGWNHQPDHMLHTGQYILWHTVTIVTIVIIGQGHPTIKESKNWVTRNRQNRLQPFWKTPS